MAEENTPKFVDPIPDVILDGESIVIFHRRSESEIESGKPPYKINILSTLNREEYITSREPFELKQSEALDDLLKFIKFKFEVKELPQTFAVKYSDISVAEVVFDKVLSQAMKGRYETFSIPSLDNVKKEGPSKSGNYHKE